MGLNLSNFAYPLPGGRVRDECGLGALVDVNVLDRDFLLAFVAMLRQASTWAAFARVSFAAPSAKQTAATRR